MTDEQILKSLECCSEGESICFMCPLYHETAHCVDELAESALDIINRQKAEIKQLRDYNQNLQVANTALSNEILETKSEAYKEFAKEICKDRVSNDPVVIAVNVELKQMAEVLNEDTHRGRGAAGTI